MSELTMSKATREAFLADVHVGVFCVNRPDGPPLATPVWYLYEPGGDVRVIIGKDSQKADLIRASGTASLCAQAESMPYRFVTVEGDVALEPVPEGAVLEVASRYLPPAQAEGYAAASDRSGSVVARLTPQRWRTNDYSGWGS